MKLSLRKLNTKALATLTQRVINASKNGKYTVVENHPLLLAVEKEYEIYDKVYAKSTFSGKGEEVAQIDKVRDKLFSGIKDILKGYSKLIVLPEHQIAKELLKIVTDLGKDISKLNYSEETAQLKKLIEEFDKAENKQKIEQLKLTAAVTSLKEVQGNFEELYSEQVEANAKLRALPSATSIRNRLEKALRNYFNLLEAMKTISDWTMIYSDINELVKAVN